MINGFWGKKRGMTQIFTESGKVVPVTVIDLPRWVVTQIKTEEQDGYSAIQLGLVKSRYVDHDFSPDWLGKKKQYFGVIKEVRPVLADHELVVGQSVDGIKLFDTADAVDVFGTTIGRGFQGVVKRHGFSGGPASHGGNLGRHPGAIGFMRTHGRVIKGWKMGGHMGSKQRAVKNLKVIKVDADNKVVMLKGSVPGKINSLLFLRKLQVNDG